MHYSSHFLKELQKKCNFRDGIRRSDGFGPATLWSYSRWQPKAEASVLLRGNIQWEQGTVSFHMSIVRCFNFFSQIWLSLIILESVLFLLFLSYFKKIFEWHWLIKLYRFQVYNSIIHHMYIAVCVHPRSSLLPSPFIPS